MDRWAMAAVIGGALLFARGILGILGLGGMWVSDQGAAGASFLGFFEASAAAAFWFVRRFPVSTHGFETQRRSAEGRLARIVPFLVALVVNTLLWFLIAKPQPYL